MKFNANPPAAVPTTPRQLTRMKYNRCRANLLAVILFSVINLFTTSLSVFYFPFSATIPNLPMDIVLTESPDAPFSSLVVPLIVGIILTVPYLLCWIFSKNRPGWMIAALVFFAFDCLAWVLAYDLVSAIIDILFHAWVMFYLITGVKHGFALKKLPEDEPLPEFGEILTEGETPAAEDNAPAFDESLFSITEEKTEDAANSNSSEE